MENLGGTSIPGFCSTCGKSLNITQLYTKGEIHDYCENCDRSVSLNIAVSPEDIIG
jgi:hypothetical protein